MGKWYLLKLFQKQEEEEKKDNGGGSKFKYDIL
jgi:hypothetical protein